MLSLSSLARAAQVVFEADQSFMQSLPHAAVNEGLSYSSYIRKNLGLDFKVAGRPGLTFSLSDSDLSYLVELYQMDESDKVGIRARAILTLKDLSFC